MYVELGIQLFRHSVIRHSRTRHSRTRHSRTRHSVTLPDLQPYLLLPEPALGNPFAHAGSLLIPLCPLVALVLVFDKSHHSLNDFFNEN